MMRKARKSSISQSIIENIENLSEEGRYELFDVLAKNGLVQTIRKIPIELIHPNPENPRKHFEQQQLLNLGASIFRDGQQTAIQVVAHPNLHGHYMLIDGERRWRAVSQRGDIKWLKATVESYADSRAIMKAMLLSHLYRDALDPIDQANIAKILSLPSDEGGYGLDRAEAAQLMGFEHSASVRNKESLIELPKWLQSLVRSGLVSESAARTARPQIKSMEGTPAEAAFKHECETRFTSLEEQPSRSEFTALAKEIASKFHRVNVLTVDCRTSTVSLNGERFSVNTRASQLLKCLIDAKGDWVTQKSHGVDHADREIKKLPEAVMAAVICKQGKGMRLDAKYLKSPLPNIAQT